MVVQLSKFGDRLQGKTAGRKHYAKICGLLAGIRQGEIVFLDFEGVQSVNGSWINMAIAPLFRWAAENQNDFFPFLIHFPEKDLDELELVAQVNQQCYAVASETHEPMQSLLVVGELDEGQRLTLETLKKLGGATGADLARELPAVDIQPTAWNNRLKDLYDKRLLTRRKDGRQQIYSLVAQELELHG